MHTLPYFDGLSSDPNVKVRLKSKIGRAQNLAKLFQLQCVDICWKPIELLHICWWYWILMAKINNFATFACWRPPWGVMCWERLVGWQKHSIIGIFIGYFNLFFYWNTVNYFQVKTTSELRVLSTVIPNRMVTSNVTVRIIIVINFQKKSFFLQIITVTSYLRHCLVWKVKTKRKFDKIKRIFSGVGLEPCS